MTDKELLELAAKAAGMNAKWINEDDAAYLAEREGLWLKGDRSPDNSKYWNPLTDDGDALRLAVKLEIALDFTHDAIDGLEVWANNPTDYCYEAIGADPCAATRRAVVRAAAAIGKEMK